jgi:starch-binding outer membrane protein, SusD/RagB family
MKNRIIILLVFISTSWGCEDYLERNPLDAPGDEAFFSTKEEINAAVIGCYNYLTLQYAEGFPVSDFCFIDATTDDLQRRTGGTYVNLIEGTLRSDNGSIQSFWNAAYLGIARCNILLDRMHKAVEQTDPSFFLQIESEARVIRAKIYLDLAFHFGDVPLIETQLSQEEYGVLTRTNRDEIFNFVIQELEESAQRLPLSFSGREGGRLTQGAAYGLAARASLYYAFLKDKSNPDQNLLSKVINYTDAIINSGVYELYPNYRELFMYAGESSKEALISEYFSISANKTHQYPWRVIPRTTGGTIIFFPLQTLIDAFECTDGKPIDESSLYNPTNPFTNRDPRLAATILLPRVSDENDNTVTHGTIWDGREYKTEIGSSYDSVYIENGIKIANEDVVSAYGSWSGLGFLKYLDPIDIPNNRQSTLSIMLMRYAEILLMNAEAHIELNDDLGKAAEYMNMVRARAYGMSYSEYLGHPSYIEANSQSKMREYLRRERRVEFAVEGLRYKDLKRWGLTIDVLNMTNYGRPRKYWNMTGLIPEIDENSIVHYSQEIVTQLLFIRNKTYESHYELWPIPQTELDFNPELGQNPGY